MGRNAIGQDNDSYIIKAAQSADMIVAAWGICGRGVHNGY